MNPTATVSVAVGCLSIAIKCAALENPINYGEYGGLIRGNGQASDKSQRDV